MHVTLIRNATLLLEYAGKRLLIDPFFAEKHSLPSFAGIAQNPLVDLPIAPEHIVQNIDMVLVSHLHTDHFDTSAELMLDRQLPLICHPDHAEKIHQKAFADVRPLVQSITWEGITFTRINGHHGMGAIEQVMGQVMGFVLQAEDEPTLYWAGDTVLCEAVEDAIKTYQPDVIVTHSGGATWANPDQTTKPILIIMDDAQTIATAKHLPEGIVIATHMEALDHCHTTREALRTTAREAGIADDHLLILADGEGIVL